ncbi:MAG: rod shape-determining protein MreC [Candidatus Latescibacterota bacterium]|nr:rod shape-determining protein MreC [Candidatus Latescibacterota bacterium]
MYVNFPVVFYSIIVIISVSLYNLSDPQKTYLSELSRTYLFAIPSWFFTDAKKYYETAIKRDFLSTQLVEASLENMSLREANLENIRLKAALEFTTNDLKRKPIPAFVISRDLDLIYDSVSINVGKNNNVKTDYCVITSKGLVGHVSSVQKFTSIVKLITRSRISGLIAASRTQGIVTWVRGHTFSLKFVDAVGDVHVGQNVITSGLGGRFPKGLPIGQIVKVKGNKTSPIFQEVLLESAVDLINLEEVFVIPVLSGSLDF